MNFLPKIAMASGFALFAAAAASPSPSNLPQPFRVVSLSVASDETLLRIRELDPNGNDCPFSILGLSPLARSPEFSGVAIAAQKFPQSPMDAERIFALRPNLVIASPFNSSELTHQIRRLGIRVELLQGMNGIEDIQSNLKRLEDWTGCKEPLRAIRLKLSEQLGDWKASHPHRQRPSVLAWNPSLTLPGRGTIFDDVVQAAGGLNILTEQHAGWAAVNAERLRRLDPDWIVVSDSSYQPHRSDQLTHNVCCAHMSAVKQGRVIVVPDALLSSASHSVGELVERLRATIVVSPSPSLPSPK